ncbi:MAG: carboxypeptidase regulatory-like domain-containing protein [Anaerolineales bacterium]|nr:carboxypeptidase regulatory-like domain-containing protein [Anaerolineales bacterium]
MKQKLLSVIERFSTRQIVLGLSGIILVPVVLLMASSFAYGRFSALPANGEHGAVTSEPQPATTPIADLPTQGNFMPLLLSSSPASTDPEVGGGIEAPSVVNGQPAQIIQPTAQPAAQEGWPLPSEAHSTTGPTPPPGISRGEITMQAASAKILDVPAYLWYRGCGPTAAGMALGYWDNQGFSNLVSDSAMTQTAAVNTMIASTEHYNDYSLPLDAPPGLILPDKSELPVGDEHADNSVADYMQTSQSIQSLYYGWSYFDRVDEGFNNYVQLTGAGYSSSTRSITMNDDFNWSVYKAEIDSGRPVVMLVDTDGDNTTDHFVTAIGYSEIIGSQMYGVRDTWDANVHWFNFSKMALGQSWGIYGGVLFNMSSTITGTITDAASAPISGVTMSTNTGVTATTNSSGVYTIGGLTPGTYTITPTLTGYTFSPTSRSVTMPPNSTAQNFTGTKCTQLVVNGDFEANTGWTLPITVYPAGYDSSVTLDVTAVYSIEMVHTGSRSVRDGIVDTAKNVYSYSSAWQNATIPLGIKSATLKFWLYPLSVGAVEGSGGDVQLMLILDQNKVEKERLVMIRSYERTWKNYEFDLKKYAGQPIWIYFGVYNNGYSSNMATYVDDVSLEACNP